MPLCETARFIAWSVDQVLILTLDLGKLFNVPFKSHAQDVFVSPHDLKVSWIFNLSTVAI